MQDRPKIKSLLEVVTTIAVLLAAGTLAGTFLFKPARTSTARIEPGLRRGLTLEPLQEVNYGDSPQTLLIALDTRCGYCAASIPFYNRLEDAGRGDGGATRIVAVFPDAADEVRQFADRQQLRARTAAAVDLGRLNLAGTPAIILVDRGGRVLDFWIGGLSAEAQQQLIARVKNAPDLD